MTLLPFRRVLPLTRGDCQDAPRPCLYTRCRHSLLTAAHPHATREKSGESCSLDVAERGEHTVVEIGEFMGISKQRVMQLEATALKKLARSAAARRLERE